MKNNFEIQPYITEKTFDMANASNKYVFLVKGKINKIELKKYVEETYKVKVENINNLAKPGKKNIDWRKNKMYRNTDKMKYVVQLKKGDKIDEFLNK
jgi:large subunit ribosomal protein L23